MLKGRAVAKATAYQEKHSNREERISCRSKSKYLGAAQDAQKP